MDYHELIFANESLVAVHKEAGIPCQSKSEHPLPLDKALPLLLGESLQLLNRIDQVVSGLVLFQRLGDNSKKIAVHHIVKKQYIAIVEGVVEEHKGQLMHYLRRDGRKNKSFEDRKSGKKSILKYEKIIQLERYTILSIHIETGRFHQIRAQMSLIGHPIKGDVKYGARRKNKNRSIDLHSYSYQLISNGDTMTITDGRFPESNLWTIASNFLLKNQNHGTE
ncbi:pseudouridine synthase [Membranihabitans marinus]|uniref:pseudouridine synthase n=1 Tax=Membranihabitans marinus TaxID=1227546 RepID=UPI001F470F25|nr:RNA pseudouridine synthase [Membranihabitans marinus]